MRHYCHLRVRGYLLRLKANPQLFCSSSRMLWFTLTVYGAAYTFADISPSAAHDRVVYKSALRRFFRACVCVPPFKLVFWLRVSSPQLAAASALVLSCGDRFVSFSLMFSSSHYNNDIPELVTPTKKHRHIFMQRCRVMYLIFFRGKVFPVIFDTLQQSVCDQLHHFIDSAVCLIVAFFAHPGISFI